MKNKQTKENKTKENKRKQNKKRLFDTGFACVCKSLYHAVEKTEMKKRKSTYVCAILSCKGEESRALGMRNCFNRIYLNFTIAKLKKLGLYSTQLVFYRCIRFAYMKHIHFILFYFFCLLIIFEIADKR